MHKTQPRQLPERTYERNIIHSPFEWMGIHTPHGWRIHKKRWGKAERFSITLSGDGKTTFFPYALQDPKTGRVEWQDDLHLKDDTFTDTGIYPSDPRVEYPIGRPRWAVSHTLLYYPVADHNLYTHEYTWDMTFGHLETHFRKHVELEEATTDSVDGKTVQVANRPISMTIEGNVHYPTPNSAVRGVWTSPDKSGPNLYARRAIQYVPMHNGVYCIAPRVPIVQCFGMYRVRPEDSLDGLFDPETGDCVDRERLQEAFLIPLDEPKLALVRPSVDRVPSKCYNDLIGVPADDFTEISEKDVENLRGRLGTRFKIGLVGYGHENAPNSDNIGYQGYGTAYDHNLNGEVDEEDLEILSRHVGRRVRYNYYYDAYFGGDWFTTSICFDPEHTPGKPAVADYVYGGGYDAQSGIVHLLDSPGPDKTVYVEYHHDAPAEPGENNIRVHLYREV